ncbi:hypothetical protein TrLO_g14341 [Triparma laevis f. longispina]|uniref:RGS domain-containing protein n=1 Tax=Triparma laevis f. longispina TaxID=1714387 RepID=A0A9W6ZL05_9STRA|nr:hypothetical protein TrLO_g14341 [Triparma laevis f. longispina]
MRKRSMTMIRVASLVPGWLAWFNLIISLEVGAPCFMFYIFALLIAPLSIGPQLTRAITLWSMFKLSHLVLSQDVLSVKRTTSNRHTKHRAGTSMSHNNETTTAVKSAIEVTAIKKATSVAIQITVWGLLAFPTTLLVILTLVLSDGDELMEEEFPKCFPEPIVVRYFSPANGLFVASLAITATCILRNSSDELGIRREITRNVVIWAVTYVAVLFVRSFDLGRLQPIMISVQQMALTYSMIVLPCGGFMGIFGGVQVFSGEGSSYRQSSGSPSYRSSASSERSVAGVDFESGLDVVLSTQGGIKKFAEHCAREFSVENIRFWQAVNQYREICNSETPEDMSETAVHIYEEYVKPGSEFQVNLPMTMAKEIKKNIDTDNITVKLLDKGQLEIFNLMERDSYQRFLQSRAQKSRRASTAGGKSKRRKSLSF